MLLLFPSQLKRINEEWQDHVERQQTLGHTNTIFLALETSMCKIANRHHLILSWNLFLINTTTSRYNVGDLRRVSDLIASEVTMNANVIIKTVGSLVPSSSTYKLQCLTHWKNTKGSTGIELRNGASESYYSIWGKTNVVIQGNGLLFISLLLSSHCTLFIDFLP